MVRPHAAALALKKAHTEEGAEEQRKANRKASCNWKADPANAEKNRENSRAWYADPVNAEKSREDNRAWKAANPDYWNNYQKTRRRDDPVFAVATRLRARLAGAVKAAGFGKSAGTFDLIGCTPQELKSHIEAQFVDGMTWENRADRHLDHVRPLASFDLADPEEQRQAMHFSNLAPVWAADNIAKGSLHEGKRHRYRKPE